MTYWITPRKSFVITNDREIWAAEVVRYETVNFIFENNSQTFNLLKKLFYITVYQFAKQTVFTS
jgi:hypothetical protein